MGLVNIAFVGRLAIEKNPGLFLQAAALLLRTCRFCRFTVIGDGELRGHLLQLSRALGIEWAVNFTGGLPLHYTRI
jgi:glycosyltransferase involved in cell wall biosynthesis